MKILRIVFENLNSLAGRWEIDLSAPDFRDGIFLISGETGAGKTTILDAVTLALFGETPRVDVSNTHDETMTRGARFCEAQVEFVCAEGVFRATWSHRRAGDESRSPFDRVRRALERRDGAGWSALPGTPSDLAEKTTKLVGAESFDQFLRTAMLAQGKFDQFLSARGAKDTDERSRILEQATGTEIYSNIGAEIFRRASAARNERDKLLQSDEGARSLLLSDEDRAGKEAERDRMAEEEKTLDAAVRALRIEAAWHEERLALEEEGAGLAREAARLSQALEAFASDDARAVEARRARALDPDRSAVVAAQTAAAQALQIAAGRAADLERARRIRESADAAARADKAAESAARSRQADRREPMARAEALDREAAALVPAVSAAQAARRAAAQAVTEAKKALDAGRAFIEAEERAAGECQSRLDAPSPALDAARRVWEAAKARRDHALAARKVVDTEWENRHGDLEGAVDLAKDALLAAETVKTYEEKRKELADGKPCPLCGATEHPYCAGALPQPDPFRLRLREMQAALSDLVSRRDAARRDFEMADEAFRNCEGECRELEENLRAEKERLQADVAAHRAGAEERCRLVAETEAALPGFENELETKTSEAERQEARLREVRERRRALGLADDLNALRQSLQTAVDEASAKAAASAVALAAATVAGERASEEKIRADRTAEVEARKSAEARVAFDAALRAGGWADEAAWEAARWDEVPLADAERRRAELKTRRDGLEALRKTHGEKRAAFAARTPSARPESDVAADLNGKTVAREAAHNAVVALETILRDDATKRGQVADRAKRIQRASATADEWDVLDKELGGEGGKRFKRFAQGITLARLVERGNRYLVPMTGGRYEMDWDPDGGEADKLLPTLVDRWAGGERRPVFNLSGGERFQVSLSLALGLSDLNAGTLRVETLFLDEGFGTLDEKALDVAIATLETVRRDGDKSIGLISHVKALDDRLTAKIVAKKRGAGQSELFGPCVRRLPPTPSREKRKTAAG